MNPGAAMLVLAVVAIAAVLLARGVKFRARRRREDGAAIPVPRAEDDTLRERHPNPARTKERA